MQYHTGSNLTCEGCILCRSASRYIDRKEKGEKHKYVELTALARIYAHHQQFCTAFRQDQRSRQTPPSVDRIRDLASVRSVEGIPLITIEVEFVRTTSTLERRVLE